MSDGSDVYYRIIRTNADDSLLTIVCMQDFDEGDYDQSRFLRAKGTDSILYFSSEEKAIKYLSTNIKPENIDPEYRCWSQADNDSFYKD